MAKRYTYNYCRAVGHSWQNFHAAKGPSFGIGVDFICSSCGTTRHDIVSPHNGELLARYYRYPDDYKTDKTTKSEWRKAWLKTLKRSIREEVNK